MTLYEIGRSFWLSEDIDDVDITSHWYKVSRYQSGKRAGDVREMFFDDRGHQEGLRGEYVRGREKDVRAWAWGGHYENVDFSVIEREKAAS